MKSLGKFPDSFLEEIAGQPAAIRRAAAGLAGQCDALAEIRRHAAGADAILFTGMGSSYDACYKKCVSAGGNTRGSRSGNNCTSICAGK